MQPNQTAGQRQVSAIPSREPPAGARRQVEAEKSPLWTHCMDEVRALSKESRGFNPTHVRETGMPVTAQAEIALTLTTPEGRGRGDESRWHHETPPRPANGPGAYSIPCREVTGTQRVPF
jgi:hypothetical protein